MLDNQNCVDNGTLENLRYQNSDDAVSLENALIGGYTQTQNENLTIEDLLNNSDNIINIQNADDYYYCNGCGELCYYTELTETTSGTRYCDDCCEYWFYCDCCNEYRDANNYEIYHTAEGEIACDCCVDDYYYSCTGCGTMVYNDNLYYDEDDMGYCCNCYHRHEEENKIHSYSYKPTPNFLKSTKDNYEHKLFYGVEIEIENKNYYDYSNNRYEFNNQIARDITNKLKGNIYCKSDGSLSTGFEIVSHPFTINFLKENRDIIKDTFKYLIDNNFRSDETSTCGLHVHISRDAFGSDAETQNKNIDKMFLFFETYKEQICKIARRNGNGYAKFMSDEFETPTKKQKYECLSLDYVKKFKDNGNRYKVINTNNSNTIEIRIFKGTLNFNTFMATIEFLDNLMAVITNNEIDKINFSRVLNAKKTEYLKEYIKLRQIKYDYKYLHDFTKYVEILSRTENKQKENIYKSLMKLGKFTQKVITEIINNKSYFDYMLDRYNDANIVYLIEKYKFIVNGYENYKDNMSNLKNRVKNDFNVYDNYISHFYNHDFMSYEIHEEYNVIKNEILKEVAE